MYYKTKWTHSRLLLTLGLGLLTLMMIAITTKQPIQPVVETFPIIKPHTFTVELEQPAPVATPAFNTIDIVIMPGDTLAKRLNEYKISAQVIHEILENEIAKPLLSKIFPGQTLTLTTDDDGQLHQLEQKIDETRSLIVNYMDEHYKAEVRTKPITKYLKYSDATIESSLFNAAMKAEIDDAITMELANIFAWDIDFVLDIRPGDRFSVLYEERFVDGKEISPGNILAAEFVSQGRIYQAIRFEDSAGHISYYTPEGRSMRKAFLRSPVKFTRISSHFNPNRKHPILHTIRAHKGVDYAAPRGTPVKAAGDGRIHFKGVEGGYGNTVMIEHGQRYMTLYAHLNSFAKGISKGTRVKQGQTIGYVGSTGLASGPHLHYEFRVNGVHKNPLTVELPASDPIKPEYKEAFLTQANSLLEQMSQHRQTDMALFQ